MCPAPLPILIKPRTRDMSPVLLTIFIEHYYVLKNIEPLPPFPDPVKIMTFNSLKLIFIQNFLAIKAHIIVPEVSNRRTV